MLSYRPLCLEQADSEQATAMQRLRKRSISHEPAPMERLRKRSASLEPAHGERRKQTRFAADAGDGRQSPTPSSAPSISSLSGVSSHQASEDASEFPSCNSVLYIIIRDPIILLF